MPPALPAHAARLAAGLSLADAARRARVTEAHLRACERANSFSFMLARRLAATYACRVDVFLPQRTQDETTGPRTRRTPATRRPRRAGERM